ncbi:hypothetical protein ACWDOR_03945 [Streptosporangium canum]|uniref:hypothetical protein n=1 Tax=Streptosporangium canum TaxID=324952 RepID=UPI00368D2D65
MQRSNGGWNQVHQGLRGYPYQDRFFIGSGEIYDARTDVAVTFGAPPSGRRVAGSGRQAAASSSGRRPAEYAW